MVAKREDKMLSNLVRSSTSSEARAPAGLSIHEPNEDCSLLADAMSWNRIIAIMLGRLGMDVEECILTYCDLMGKVFGRKVSRTRFSFLSGNIKAQYSSEVFRQAVVAVLKTKDCSADTFLFDEEADGAHCKTFVCVTAKQTTWTHRLKTYDVHGDRSVTQNPTICEAIMATAAATSFFEHVTIGTQQYVDGGLGANNPVLQVAGEAVELWQDKFEGGVQDFTQCIVSIGTGHPGKDSIDDSAIKIWRSLKELATDCERTNEEFQREWRKSHDEDRVFRFNVQHGMCDIKLDSFETKGQLQVATSEYLNETPQRRSLDQCVSRLCIDSRYIHQEEDFRIAFDERRGFRRKRGNFIERSSILNVLHGSITASVDRLKIIGVYGLTGCGKTELATSYGRKYHDEYTSCFRVDGKSAVDFETSMAGLASVIATLGLVADGQAGCADNSMDTPNGRGRNIAKDCENVIEWLNKDANTGWLLLIDDVNYTDPRHENESERRDCGFPEHLSKRLDSFSHGTIILTTQSKSICERYPSFGVDKMLFHEGLSLVQNMLGKDFDEAGRLVTTLEFHAQSIDCAACYIRQQVPAMTIDRYLQCWAECEAAATFPTVPSLGRPLSATLKLAFDKLSQASQALIKLCAFFNPLHISMDLLTASPQRDARGKKDARAEQNDRLSSTQAMVTELAGLCLVKSGEGAISIHPAVYKFVELTMAASDNHYLYDYLEHIGAAVKHIGQSLPQRHEKSYTSSIQHLALHVEACTRHLEQFRGFEWPPEVLWNISNMAKIQCEVGRSKPAKKLYRLAYEGYERTGRFSNHYVRVLHDWGTLHLRNGDPGIALDYFVLVDKKAGQYKIDIPDAERLNFELNRGIALRDLDRLKDAEEIFQNCLRLSERMSPSKKDRLQVARVKLNRGKLMQKQGDYRSASKMIRESIREFETYGVSSQAVRIPFAHQDLAEVYKDMLEFGLARKHYQFACPSFADIFGSNSARVLENRFLRVQTFELEHKTQQRSSSSLIALETLYNESLQLWRDQCQHLGESDPLTLRTATLHANACIALNRDDEAFVHLGRARLLYERRHRDVKDPEAYHYMLYCLAKCLISQAEDLEESEMQTAREMAEDAFSLLERCSDHASKTNKRASLERHAYIQLERAKAIKIFGSREDEVAELEILMLCSHLDEAVIEGAKRRLVAL